MVAKLFKGMSSILKYECEKNLASQKYRLNGPAFTEEFSDLTLGANKRRGRQRVQSDYNETFFSKTI